MKNRLSFDRSRFPSDPIDEELYKRFKAALAKHKGLKEIPIPDISELGETGGSADDVIATWREAIQAAKDQCLKPDNCCHEIELEIRCGESVYDDLENNRIGRPQDVPENPCGRTYKISCGSGEST